MARYFADLEPVFEDLPPPHPKSPVATSAVALTKSSAGPPTGRYEGGRGALGGGLGETLVALSPFIALALFFLSPWHTWLFFLLVPVLSVLVYGGSHGRRHGQYDPLDRLTRARGHNATIRSGG